MKFLFIYITAAALVVPIYLEKQEINLVLKHIATFSNEKYVKKIAFLRKPINRTTSIVSKDVYFQPNVSLESPLYIEFVANKKFATVYRPFMLRFKIDICDNLKGKNHPYFRFIEDINNGQNNMLDPCPIKGHRFIKPFYTKFDNYLALIPVGIWRCDITITKAIDDKEELVFGYREFYEVTPKGIIEF